MNSRTSITLIALSLVAGPAAAQTTQAVEWKVSEGGNGHWYRLVRSLSGQRISWLDAKGVAESFGGHLACVSSAEENLFLWTLVPATSASWPSCGPRACGPFLGGVRAIVQSDAAAGWVWIDGTPWTFTNWAASEPANGGGSQNYLKYWFDPSSPAPDWGDDNVDSSDSFMVEWSADCNGDGIVDYGQIKSGQLADDNANGVPDICELSVTGVVPPSVPSQGGSAITIKGNNFPENPVVLVGGLPATDVVRVSATRITATTPSLLPGMASVKVNNFTLEEALYIRPQCGSDLDQDGEVTAADIAIVLLDFGPCYVTASSPQADDSKPFMLREQPALEAPQSR